MYSSGGNDRSGGEEGEGIGKNGPRFKGKKDSGVLPYIRRLEVTP